MVICRTVQYSVYDIHCTIHNIQCTELCTIPNTVAMIFTKLQHNVTSSVLTTHSESAMSEHGYVQTARVPCSRIHVMSDVQEMLLGSPVVRMGTCCCCCG